MNGSLRPTHTAPLLLPFLLMSGCTWGMGQGGNEATEMHRRFSRTVDIQTGVVLGDLDGAKDAAAWLSTYEGTGGFPENAEQYVNEMKGHASHIARAPDLEAAAAGTGPLASACGACHAATGGGPNFVLGSGPPQGESRAEVMIRHLWAADRMWEGLVGPSQEAWMAGAKTFGQSWGPFAEAIQSSTSPDAPTDLMAEIQRLARTAETVETREARAAVYGEILGTCNGCHRLSGVTTAR